MQICQRKKNGNTKLKTNNMNNDAHNDATKQPVSFNK